MLNNMFEKYFTSKNILFSIGVIIFLLLITKMQDIAIMFFASFVIACSLNPLVEKLSAKYKRSTAVSIVMFLTLLIFAVCFVPLIVIAGHEIKHFAISFPKYLTSIKEFASNSPFINTSEIPAFDINGAITTASSVSSKVFNEVFNFGKNIGSAVVYFIISIILIYYFLADKKIINDAYISCFPKQMREKAQNVLDIISEKIGGYVIGQIAAMASVCLFMTIGLSLLRVDYALLLGLITAILDLVPVVGPGIALFICFIAAYKSGPIVLTLIAVVFAITQLAENNLVKPYVFGKLLDLHPIIIYLFLFITAKYMGVIGVIFAPAIAATVCVLIQELYIKNLAE